MQIGLEVSQTGKAHQVDAFGSTMSSWFSRKQSSVSLSTAKAEYIADCSAKLWIHMASEADIRSLWPEYGDYNDSMW